MIFHLWWILAFFGWLIGNYLLAGFLISIKWAFKGYGWASFNIAFGSEVKTFEVLPLFAVLVVIELILGILMLAGVSIRF